MRPCLLGQAAEVTFTVSKPAVYRVAVDSPGESGTFAIEIEGQ